MTCRTPRRLLAVLVAALIGAAAGQVAPAPADAAGGYCPVGTGVTVIVDYGSLGAGRSVGCDPRGAQVTGSTVVARAGYSLSYVVRQPGFVCRVDGLPGPSRESCGTTPPQNAYWGLFWSDGRSGRWTYASEGIGSLRVPAGGFIGWRFQGATRTVPGLSPVSPRPSPKPSPKPSPTPTPRPTSHPTPRPTHHQSQHPTHRVTHHSTHRPAHGPGASLTRSAAAATTRRAATGPASTARTSAGPSSTGSTRSPRASGGRSSASAPTTTPSPAATTAGSGAPSATSQPSSSLAAAAAGSPSGAAGPAATAGTDLQSGEQSTGSPAALPVLAGGLAVVLLGSAGVVAYRRRRSE